MLESCPSEIMIASRQTILSRKPIEPFYDRSSAYGMTYGLGPAGYDVRIAQTLWLWPFWGRRASTIEYFRMPSDLAAEVKDKSTNARRFILVQNTFIDPGWCGYLTLELTRFLLWPVRIEKGTPIAQIVFYLLDEPTDQPYRGRYFNQQAGVQPAILDKEDSDVCGSGKLFPWR